MIGLHRLAILAILLAVSSAPAADDIATVEAWLGKSGKLVRSKSGQVDSVTHFGEKSVAGKRDSSVVERRFTDDDLEGDNAIGYKLEASALKAVGKG